ncbi:MAG: hypothetical protein G3M70_07220 [Candidatus Nitronauta litoralis]|uniref:Lipoprotein n=1 Tax=Candidatus Nitronauta litoralis TaxID=2705533 RepID=A0A7T0BWD4_9BACT|nr:MAG: hypothetical protein G3M70_07220 [Candidatus Nitronauta litoralis]
MKFLITILISLVLAGCSTFSTVPTEAMSAAKLEMVHVDGQKETSLNYSNPKSVGGEFTGHAWVKIDPVTGKVDMGVKGGAQGGTDVDLSHAVEHARVQSETIRDGLKTMRGLAEKFPGLAGGL